MSDLGPSPPRPPLCLNQQIQRDSGKSMETVPCGRESLTFVVKQIFTPLVEFVNHAESRVQGTPLPAGDENGRQDGGEHQDIT